MKTISRILTDLARVVGVSVPDPSASDLTIPPLLQPVIDLISPLDVTFATAGTDVMNNSFHIATGVSIQAGVGGPVANPVLIVGAGLWEFNCYGVCTSDYVSTTLLGDGSLQLLMAGGGAIYLGAFSAGGVAAAPQSVTMQRTTRILLPKNATLSINAANNAAGQHLNVGFDLVANKLL